MKMTTPFRKLALLLGFMALLMPGFASADGVGLMLGGGAYYTQVDDDVDLDYETIEDNVKAFFDDKSGGYNLAIGWRFNKWIALDAGYWDLGSFNSDRFEDGDKAKIEVDTFSLGGIVSVPLWILDLYARGGAAFWDADSRNYSEDGTDPYYGVGVALNVGGSLDFYLEILRFDLDDTDIDTAGLGVRWTF